MTDSSKTATDALREEILQFRARFRSAVLGTVDSEGTPLASYAPFVTDEAGNFYVFVSGLSQHTRQMVENPRVSFLLLEDEQNTPQPFVRRRLTYACRATPVPRELALWQQTLERFASRFGDIIETLRSLADFQLFQLTPVSGNYVRGFGQAYRLEGADLAQIHHLVPRR